MDSGNIPGFTAERSLGASSASYRSLLAVAPTSTDVNPQEDLRVRSVTPIDWHEVLCALAEEECRLSSGDFCHWYFENCPSGSGGGGGDAGGGGGGGRPPRPQHNA